MASMMPHCSLTMEIDFYFVVHLHIPIVIASKRMHFASNLNIVFTELSATHAEYGMRKNCTQRI